LAARADAALTAALARAAECWPDRWPGGPPGAARAVAGARARLRNCVEGVARSSLYADVAAAGATGDANAVYVGADAAPLTFRLDGGPVSVSFAPDLLYLHTDQDTCPVPLDGPTWVLVELKSAEQADPRQERAQLAVYALGAVQALGAATYRGGFLARVVRPRHAGGDTWVRLTSEDLDGVRRRVAVDRRRIDAAIARLTSGLVASAVEAFPATIDARACARCEVAAWCPLRRRTPSRVRPEAPAGYGTGATAYGARSRPTPSTVASAEGAR
jgi:hypothetical protein